jgi:putative ABC transport system ATP-binding protein
MSEVVVETIGLAKTYRRGKIDVPALRGINLQIRRKDVACIVGPSGSGKSSLLHLIAGLDEPTSGSVNVDGVDLSKLNSNQLADLRLRKMGFIFQFYNLIPTLTALENVELPLALMKSRKTQRRNRAHALLQTVGLAERTEHKPEELSGGEQQRVAIARALANEPSVILADEPTGDLDSKTAIDFMNLIGRLNRENGQTFIIVTHDPLVVRSSTRAFKIRDGLLEKELSSEDLKKVDVIAL